jgi:hypothetical protein
MHMRSPVSVALRPLIATIGRRLSAYQWAHNARSPAARDARRQNLCRRGMSYDIITDPKITQVDRHESTGAS